jgi:ribonuclease T1
MMAARACLAACALGLAAFTALAEDRGPPPAPPVGEIHRADLPAEAHATLELIAKKGPYPYAKDGAIFGNREGHLPKQRRGYYREYTVRTPGNRNRGARRIVKGASGELFYSDDHYNSFKRIRE